MGSIEDCGSKAPHIPTGRDRDLYILDRNANRDVALVWKDSIYKTGKVKILPCTLKDLEQSWKYFKRTDFHKFSSVDATSFVIMNRTGIRRAFAFDHHFSVAGFRLVA